MKQIFLSGKYGSIIGNYALVDDEDFDELNKYKWWVERRCKKDQSYVLYVGREISKGPKMLLHRQIMNASKGQMIDHKDGDGLNNQKANIRFCTPSENQKNRRGSGTSKYLGVHLTTRENKKTTNIYSRWVASITVDRKQIVLGYFKSEEEAALVYNVAAKKHHKGFARLNVIE